MRRFAALATTIGAVLAIAGVAYAANVYSSTSRYDPAKTGTSSKPAPEKANLTFKVTESDPSLRPLPIKTYGIGLGPGIVPNNLLFGGCSFSQASTQDQYANIPLACRKSVIGGGSVRSLAGAPSDRNAAFPHSFPCYLDIALINSTKKNHLNIRVDSRDAPTTPKDFKCIVPLHQAIDAKFVKTASVAAKGGKGKKLPVYAIVFDVPDSLLHPSGLDNALVSDVTNVFKKKAKVGKGKKAVTHGYLESIGCPKGPSGKREASNTYTNTAGVTKTSASRSKCKS